MALITIEATWLPAKLVRQSPANLFHAVAYLFSVAYRYMWVPLLYVFLLSVLELVPVRRRLGPRVRVVARVVLAGGVAWHAYWVMTKYEGFAGKWQIAAAFAGVAALLAAASLTTRTTRRSWRRFAAPLVLVVLAFCSAWFNHVLSKGLYATLHVAGAELSMAAFGVAALHLAGRDLLPIPRQRWIRIALASLVLVALVGLPFAIFESGKTARKYVRAKTYIGLARTIHDPDALERYERRGRVQPVDEAKALELFARHSGLPALPDGFRLTDYDIVLITIDALRWDMTSLADPALGTTPNLAAFAEESTFNFTRAHSPSSTTLQSMSSVMTMMPPAAAHLDIWKMTWAGRLRLSATTVAELLSDTGYATHWIGHDHQNVFSQKIIGIEQGFDSRQLVEETEARFSARGVDARIAEAAITKIDEIPDTERFFAWFFLVSPHAPYVVHDRKAPSSTLEERYLQEVRNADRHLGRILTKLRREGLLDSSIVIVTADHGEELGERGGERHAATLYEEVTHVPLLIRIPGMAGGQVDAPTSLIYLFPWLLLHTEGPAREQVLNVLRLRLGPLMQGTQGAIPMELLGKELDTSALLLGDLKLVYDHGNEILEVYDLAADPGETNDLSFSDPERVAPAHEALERYLDVREYGSNFRLQPKRKVWRASDDEWLEQRVESLGETLPETDELEVEAPRPKPKLTPRSPRKSKAGAQSKKVVAPLSAKPVRAEPRPQPPQGPPAPDPATPP